MIVFSEATTPLQVSMKNPELMDAEEVATNTIVHVAMDGSLRTYRRTPMTYKVKMAFNMLSRVKALEFMDFAMATAGMQLQLIDHRGTTWRGKLLADSIDIATDEPGPGRDGIRKEGNSMSLEFEGTKVPA